MSADTHLGQSVSTTHVLWARSERYKTPFVVAAWSDGYADAWSDAFWTEVEERKSYVECFGEASDGPWVFCLTVERIAHPDEYSWSADPLDPDVTFVPIGKSGGVEDAVDA
jgi:hypothetical protein